MDVNEKGHEAGPTPVGGFHCSSAPAPDPQEYQGDNRIDAHPLQWAKIDKNEREG